MSPKTYRIVAKLWPLTCGLIIGGLLGGIMQSFAAFLLFGVIGWAYFYFDMFYMLSGTPYAESSQDEDENGIGDTLRKAMDRQCEEESMAAAGIEPYASMYGYSHH